MRLGWSDCWHAKMATWYLTLFHLFIFNSLNSVRKIRNSLAFLPLLMLLKANLWEQWDGSESKRCLLWNIITWTLIPRTHLVDVWLASASCFLIVRVYVCEHIQIYVIIMSNTTKSTYPWNFYMKTCFFKLFILKIIVKGKAICLSGSKTLIAKPQDMSLISIIHMMERIDPFKLSSDLYKCSVVCIYNRNK